MRSLCESVWGEILHSVPHKGKYGMKFRASEPLKSYVVCDDVDY